MKKTHWLILIVTAILVSALFLGACSEEETTTSPSVAPPSTPTTSEPPPPPIELNYNTMGPPALKSAAIALEYLASEMEKRSEGRVKITILYGSPLAPPPGIYDAVASGTADMADCMATYFIGRLPASEIAELPIGCPSSIILTRALNDWYNKFKPPEWDEVKLLSIMSSPPAQIGTRSKAVRTIADIKDQTLRVPGSTVGNTITALGGIPRSIPIGEVFENLSKGVIEGCAMSVESYPGFHIHEAINYVTDVGTESSWGAFIFMAMNMESWNKLQPKDQETLAALATEAWEMRAEATDTDVEGAKGLLLSQPGREYIMLPAAEQAKLKDICQPLIEKYINDIKAIGLPGDEYVKYLQERIEYWKTH